MTDIKILVDADACPVKSIIVEQAKKRNIPVIMICDTSHQLNDGYSTVFTVDKGRDSADLKLISLLNSSDIVVTQDYGVAAMALSKNARAINQNGLIYDKNNIDQLLFERHMAQKARRNGGKASNCKKRTKQDDDAFEAAFISLLIQEDKNV